MNWRDEGIILSLHSLGENGRIASVLTLEYGRSKGFYKSQKSHGYIDVGRFVQADWSARLREQLGRFVLSPLSGYDRIFAKIIQNSAHLFQLNSILNLLDQVLPENQAVPEIFHQLREFMMVLPEQKDFKSYYLFERDLLAALGFELELSSCAVTGVDTGLTHVSPKTGRAVCADAAAPYESKLLKLPQFLYMNAPANTEDFVQAHDLLGFFWDRDVMQKKYPLGARSALREFVASSIVRA